MHDDNTSRYHHPSGKNPNMTPNSKQNNNVLIFCLHSDDNIFNTVLDIVWLTTTNHHG
jgi:hypothetical protein